jgi:hypothetical protein
MTRQLKLFKDMISTPRGVVWSDKNGKASLEWNSSNFNGGDSNSWVSRYSAAQKFVDSEVLRLCEPYIPLLTGVLVMTGILGTDVGSGTVSWIAPYARYQYYGHVMYGKAPKKVSANFLRYHGGGMRGMYWFERMKHAHGREIVAGARKIAGGGK